MPDKMWDFFKDTFQVVFFAVILTFILRAFIIEARQIPSGSMLPTLQIGDRVLVDKIAYKFNGIERGDIVVFTPPPEARTPEVGKNDLIKRVIGLPGEKVEVNNSQVYINDKPIKEPYIKDEPLYSWGPETVPDGELFVMGDNRNNSFDSHAWGFLPEKNIKGRAFMRFWPFKRVGKL